MGWGNGTTTNKFYEDLTYPQVPVGLTLTDAIKNYGPDADKFRDPNTGSIRDASDEGTFITSFTSHRSPLGLAFDNAGKLIKQLVNENKEAGIYQASYSTGNLPAGIYFFKLQAGSFSETKKFTIAR